MYRGSRKHVLDWVEHPNFTPELLELIRPITVKVTSRSTWTPQGYRWPDEARLEQWGPGRIGSEETWTELQRWWLAAPRGANTPNWDLAVVAEIEGEMGLVLVEAKANVPELSPHGKDQPSASENSQANHERIGAAIEQDRVALSGQAPGLTISRDTHYQLSNRLAFTWKLAEMGIPVVLVYLGFTVDNGIRDAGEPFADDKHWQRVFEGYAGDVGAATLFEKRHQLNGAPFWLLSRSRPVLQVSSPKTT